MIARIKGQLGSVKTTARHAKTLSTVMALLDGLYAVIDELDTASVVLPRPNPLPEDIASALSIPSLPPKGKTK